MQKLTFSEPGLDVYTQYPFTLTLRRANRAPYSVPRISPKTNFFLAIGVSCNSQSIYNLRMQFQRVGILVEQLSFRVYKRLHAYCYAE